MNRFTWKSFLFAGIYWALCSCQDSRKTEETADLLSAPPFNGLTDSIALFPKDAHLYSLRAALLSQNNLHDIATADYQKSWELSGDEHAAMRYVSNLLLTEQVEEAEDVLLRAEKKFPESTEFNRRLGEVYFQQGKFQKALQQYDDMLEKDSTNFEAWFDRGILQAKMKDTGNAIHSLETSFSLLPINYSGIALANLYAARKDPRALEICNILLARDSGDAQTEPLYVKGIYYSGIKEYDKALQHFDECIRRDWKMTDAYIEKGIIQFERGKYDEALDILNLAATVSNTDPDVYYWMGRCFELKGDTQKAITNYQRAFALDHSFSEAREALKRLNG